MLRMTTSPLAADFSGCWDTRWLDLLAGCQGLPEQIAALRRASIVCVLGRAPPGRVSWPRLAGELIGIRRRHLVVRNALLGEPAAVNTRGVVGGRVGAGAGRSSVDSVDGSPLPSGADTALAGHPG